MRTNYDIVGEKVCEFWKKTCSQPVVVFFSQKYEFEDEWEQLAEIAYPDNYYDEVVFENDFWEGQTEVKDIKIVPFDEILQFYIDNKGGDLNG